MSIGQNFADADATTGEGTLSPGLTLLLRLGRDLRFGTLHVRLPGGGLRRFAGSEPGPTATLQIHRARVARRFLTGGAVGFAESYIDGDWDSPDLASLLELLDRNYAAWSDHHFVQLPCFQRTALRERSPGGPVAPQRSRRQAGAGADRVA